MDNKRILELECGDTMLLMECIDTQSYNEIGTKPSGILEDTINTISEDVFADLATMSQSIANRFRSGFETSVNMPKEMELEFNFAITTSGKLLILSGETQTGIKLKLTWKN